MISANRLSPFFRLSSYMFSDFGSVGRIKKTNKQTNKQTKKSGLVVWN